MIQERIPGCEKINQWERDYESAKKERRKLAIISFFKARRGVIFIIAFVLLQIIGIGYIIWSENCKDALLLDRLTSETFLRCESVWWWGERLIEPFFATIIIIFNLVIILVVLLHNSRLLKKLSGGSR